ncbi:hypothetical protein KP509_25G062900 [Ceratopteris richardii]|uniref:diaminopimelate epimerase n=2 Tax=Ceratopteris richardii TaxID=49495 RepID=A0A8T2RR31_CERRI|nr:hypothetical protein KP509_25G062900 [Ceratopteris richardii]
MAAFASVWRPHLQSTESDSALASFHCIPSSSRLVKLPEKLTFTAFSSSRSLCGLKVRTSSVMLEKTLETAKKVSSKEILDFSKYQGLGNDFLLVDNRDSAEPKISPEQAVKLCDRNFGVGADGVIFAMPGINGSDYSMRIFNSDGSEPEMCGNGIRCMARFVANLENAAETRSYNIHTLAGLIIPKLREDGQVEVDMGAPILNAPDVPTKLTSSKDGAVVKVPLNVDGENWLVTCVSMGNPHCVTFAREDGKDLEVNCLPLEKIGPLFEHHEVFPARTNTEFIQVISRSHVRMRVWERGAGATLACGTGACAVVVAGVLEGRTEKKCTVDLPGGPLEIEWRENNHVYMTGPAELVFEGKAFL